MFQFCTTDVLIFEYKRATTVSSLLCARTSYVYKGVKVRLKVLQAVSEGFLILYFWSCVERVWNFVVSKNATVVLLHRLNFRSFSIYRWFCLFPGRNVACSYFLLYAYETDLVLSKTECERKRFRKDILLF